MVELFFVFQNFKCLNSFLHTSGYVDQLSVHLRVVFTVTAMFKMAKL